MPTGEEATGGNPTQEDIDDQQELLQAHRRRLKRLLIQKARLGIETPPHVYTEIEDIRASIERIKARLREWGVPVEDKPGDKDTATLVAPVAAAVTAAADQREDIPVAPPPPPPPTSYHVPPPHPPPRNWLLLSALLLLIIVVVILALVLMQYRSEQEARAQAAIATAAAQTATAAVTPTPTPTDTATATPVPTESPTATATESPTATATESPPTPTPTPTPTATPNPEPVMVFGQPVQGDTYSIVVMRATGVTETLSVETSGNPYPDMSPNGREIVFESDGKIYKIHIDGTGKARLAGGSVGQNHQPVWSPDGTRIAFHSNRAGDWDLYVMDADGSDPINLTDDHTDTNSGLKMQDMQPDWSPDGAWIAFASAPKGTGLNVYVMRSDGSEWRSLTGDPSSEDSLPCWSPDGAQIVFTSKRYGAAGALYRINADGPPGSETWLYGPGWDCSWSHEGKIAFVCGGAICVMDAEGQQVTRRFEGAVAPGWRGP